MILSDYDIKQNFERFVPVEEDRNYDLINPASFDVRIGRNFMIEKMPEESDLDLNPNLNQQLVTRIDSGVIPLDNFSAPIFLGKQQVYWLDPNETILVSMMEWTQVPDDMEMMFALKSSRAREGYEHANSGLIDPGWAGILTMELKNNLRYNQLPVYPGLRIGQLEVRRLTSKALRPYKGRYLLAQGVQTAKPREYDCVLEGKNENS